MRTKVAAFAAGLLLMGASALWAAATATDAKAEVTLKGTLECAKCQLHETKTCQNVLAVKDGDKQVLYYLTQNDVSKTYHKNVCSDPKENVTVTGTVSEKDGKKVLEATKIESPAA